MEKRSLFKKIFGTENQVKKTIQKVELLNEWNPIFYKQDAIESAIVKKCIDTIATHVSKFDVQHKQYTNDNIRDVNGNINFMLQYKPNPLMNTSQFLYKIAYTLFSQNNSFVYIEKDKDGMILAFYPINAQSYELLEDSTGSIYLRFVFGNGKTYELPYEEIIHLRRFYNKHEIFGDDNKSLKMPVEASDTALQGIENAIKSTSGLRGLIKYTNSMLKPEDMKKNKDEFVKDYLNMENESGIAVLDSRADFSPIKIDPITLTDEQLKYLNDNVYKYFGLNESIINNSYTAEQWNSFFEGCIEPLAIQMEQEFTNKIFNISAVKNGHKIVFGVERIRYAKLTDKINLIKELGQLGIFTIDEARKVLDMAPIGGEEGNKRLQSLNFVDSNIANEYQLGSEAVDNE